MMIASDLIQTSLPITVSPAGWKALLALANQGASGTKAKGKVLTQSFRWRALF